MCFCQVCTRDTAKGMEWDTVQPGFLLLWCTTLWILQLYLGRRDAETPQLAAQIENTSRLRWLALASCAPLKSNILKYPKSRRKVHFISCNIRRARQGRCKAHRRKSQASTKDSLPAGVHHCVRVAQEGVGHGGDAWALAQ